ncbi:acriflavin resistance protein [Raoultella ornithinolytica]|nr:acriflavin resistance protein [Raoultella ornithinolytica]
MDISRQFINNPVRVWLTILLLGIGGIFALLNIGRLEDPAFTIKTAVVITHYPGASAQQVEEEVTLPLENALQQLPYLDNVSSISSNGLSQITGISPRITTPTSCRKSGTSCGAGWAMRPASFRRAWFPPS